MKHAGIQGDFHSEVSEGINKFASLQQGVRCLGGNNNKPDVRMERLASFGLGLYQLSQLAKLVEGKMRTAQYDQIEIDTFLSCGQFRGGFLQIGKMNVNRSLRLLALECFFQRISFRGNSDGVKKGQGP